MTDEVEPADVALLDRSELIALVQKLERQRSVWELRVRACQERESMFLSFVNDLGTLIAATFQAQFHELYQKKEKVEKLIEQMQMMAKKVEQL